MKLEYRGFSKCCTLGPGGMKCPCCSPMNMNPRKSKPLMRRIVRRVSKQQLEKGLDNE